MGVAELENGLLLCEQSNKPASLLATLTRRLAVQLLRRFSKDAVALHLKHLSLARRGAESHSIVVMVRPSGPC